MTDTKTTLESGLQELRTLRDQIRVKLHLAGQDARDAWENRLEPQMEDLERKVKTAAGNAMDSLRGELDRAREAFREYRDRLSSSTGDEPPTDRGAKGDRGATGRSAD